MEYLIDRKRIYGIGLSLVIWILLIFSAPVLYSVPDPATQNISAMVYALFKPTCHQLPSRSFHLSGHALAVCIRCMAFYTAGLILTVIYLFSRQIKAFSPVYYIVLILPALIDFLLEKANFYHNNPMLRFSTGFMAGLVVFHLLLLAISEKKAL